VIRRALIDLSPLRTNRAFARLYAGSAASGLGSAMTQFAILFQAWDLTRNPAATGMVAMLGALPAVVLMPVGGSLADRHDRRILLLLTTSGNTVVVLVLAAQAFAGSGSLALVYAMVVAQGCLTAVGAPAREAVLPTLVGAGQVGAARALGTLSWQATALAGPALAGLVTVAWGVQLCYVLDAVSFLLAFLGMAGLPRLVVRGPATPHLRGLVDGLRLIAANRPVRAAFALDAGLTVLAFPVALMPALNAHLGGTPRTLGYLMSCLALGGVGATLVSGSVTRARRPGAAMSAMAFIWCCAVVALGSAPTIPLAMMAMTAWGAADILLSVPRGTLVQLATPDPFLGRLAAANQIVGRGGPALGDARGGLLGAAIGVGPALVLGGISAALVTAVVARRLPEARTFTVDEADGTTGAATGR
jgi:MFS family permease